MGRESKAELLPCPVRLITQPQRLSGKEAVSGAPGRVGASVSQTAHTFTVRLDAPAPLPPLSTVSLFFTSFRRQLHIASLNGKLASLIGCSCPSSVSRESPCSAGDPGSFPGSGRSPGEGNGNPLQCSCLGNPMDRGWGSPWSGKESDPTERLNYHSVTEGAVTSFRSSAPAGTLCGQLWTRVSPPSDPSFSGRPRGRAGGSHRLL